MLELLLKEELMIIVMIELTIKEDMKTNNMID